MCSVGVSRTYQSLPVYWVDLGYSVIENPTKVDLRDIFSFVVYVSHVRFFLHIRFSTLSFSSLREIWSFELYCIKLVILIK